MMACCEYTYEQYVNLDGTVDQEAYAAIVEKYRPEPIECPNEGCENQGWYAQIMDGDWEQEQCEFCNCEPNSVYNRNLEKEQE